MVGSGGGESSSEDWIEDIEGSERDAGGDKWGISETQHTVKDRISSHRISGRWRAVGAQCDPGSVSGIEEPSQVHVLHMYTYIVNYIGFSPALVRILSVLGNTLGVLHNMRRGRGLHWGCRTNCLPPQERADETFGRRGTRSSLLSSMIWS